MASGLLAAALLIVPTVASQPASGGPPGGGPSGPRECRPDERRTVLRQEQEAVLSRVGSFKVLRNQADLLSLGQQLNYVLLLHWFTSFRGIGLTILDPFDTPRAGVPNLLFYSPSKKAKDATDPNGPDFPYTLVGWGYGMPYDPGRLPNVLPCLGLKDWMIHERGVHPYATGGMHVMPPTETYYGESLGSFVDPPAMDPAIGFPHPRSWTVHFWLEDGDTPVSAIVDPHNPPAGLNAGVGSSFYFPEARERAASPAAQASSIQPFIVHSDDGKTVKIRASSFRFIATDQNTGGAMGITESVIRHGSEPPRHIHHRQAEAFYILEGQMLFQAAGQTFSAGKGDFIFLPRGVAHAYRVTGNGTARVLIFSAPPGLELFFADAAKYGPTNLDVARAHGIEPVGPPLGAGQP
jgi:quercetin dioxygenase-like cupin family protein